MFQNEILGNYLVCFNSKGKRITQYRQKQQQQLKSHLPSCQFNITTTFCEAQSPVAKLVNFNMLLLKTRFHGEASRLWCAPAMNKVPTTVKLSGFDNELLLKTRPHGSMSSSPCACRLVLYLLTCVISCVRISISCSSSTSSNTSGRVECFSCSWPSSCTGGEREREREERKRGRDYSVSSSWLHVQCTWREPGRPHAKHPRT